MIGFFIKKSFFDGWDNLLTMIGVNLGAILILAAAYGAIALGLPDAVTMVLLLAVVFLYSIYATITARFAYSVSAYSKASVGEMFHAIREHFSHLFVFFLLNAFIFLACFFIMPFYFSMGNMVGLVLCILIFWATVIAALAQVYYLPLAFYMDEDKALKTLKKCLLVVGDNLPFTLFLALYNLINLVISVLLAFLMPSYSGIMIGQMNATRLLLLKYDYIEAHPGVKKKDIIWEDLLYEEKERVGKRSLKGMIFPWKD